MVNFQQKPQPLCELPKEKVLKGIIRISKKDSLGMFCSKRSTNMIDGVHKRALRAVYQLFDTSFSELLIVDQSSQKFAFFTYRKF